MQGTAILFQYSFFMYYAHKDFKDSPSVLRTSALGCTHFHDSIEKAQASNLIWNILNILPLEEDLEPRKYAVLKTELNRFSFPPTNEICLDGSIPIARSLIYSCIHNLFAILKHEKLARNHKYNFASGLLSFIMAFNFS